MVKAPASKPTFCLSQPETELWTAAASELKLARGLGNISSCLERSRVGHSGSGLHRGQKALWS